MFTKGKWEINGAAQRLPDGRFAARACATYHAGPHVDDHPLEWSEPTFDTAGEAAAWGLQAGRAWLAVREDCGE